MAPTTAVATSYPPPPTLPTFRCVLASDRLPPSSPSSPITKTEELPVDNDYATLAPRIPPTIPLPPSPAQPDENMGCGMVTPDEWDVVAHNILKQPQEEPDDVPDYIPLPHEIRVPLFPESPSVVSDMSILHSVNFLSNRKRIEGVERDKWGKIIRPCGVGECTYKSSNTTCMKNHRESKHGVEPPSRDSLAPQGRQQSRMGASHWRWVPGVERDRGGKIIRKCGIDGCTYMARATNMKSHQATRHDVNVKWFTCGVGDCYYRAKSLGQVKRHKQTNHNIGIQFHKCTEPGCDYRSRQLSAIKKHMERTHTAWLDCDVPNCNYKAKRSGNLKQHKLFTHSVGVTWHPCVIGGCTYKAKTAGNLNQHVKTQHPEQVFSKGHLPSLQRVSLQQAHPQQVSVQQAPPQQASLQQAPPQRASLQQALL